MNQRSIKMDNAAVTAALFGSFDVNTRILENRFGVSLHNRSDGDGGDAVLISGESPEAVNAAATAVEYLRDMLRLSDSLNEQTVRYVADTVAEGRASELTSLSPDIICLTAKGKPVKAKTAGQSKYVEAIRQNTIVLGVGPAGTGKTFLAVAMAVKALREKQVSRIILTRPAIEAGERLGFLPGDLLSKIDPYLRPLYDALDEMLGPETVQSYMEKRIIEIAPLAYMRGRTLKSMFLLCDECQNMSIAQHLMILTRLGEGSKMVLTGDVTQIDLPSPQDSGLERCADILEGIDDIEVIRLTGADVVRHKLVGKIITAFENNKAAPGQPAEKKPGQPTQKPAYRNNNRFSRKK